MSVASGMKNTTSAIATTAIGIALGSVLSIPSQLFHIDNSDAKQDSLSFHHEVSTVAKLSLADYGKSVGIVFPTDDAPLKVATQGNKKSSPSSAFVAGEPITS